MEKERHMAATVQGRPALGRLGRLALLATLGIGIATALAGCVSLGGGSPPNKTVIVTPQGSHVTKVPDND